MSETVTEGLGSEESAVAGPVTLRWRGVYNHKEGRLRAHGRRTASTHELRQLIQSSQVSARDHRPRA